MDPALLAEWGIPGALLAGALLAIRALYHRVNEVQDQRIADWKEQSRQLSENVKVLDEATRQIEGRRNA